MDTITMLLIEKLNIIVSSEMDLHTFRTNEQEILIWWISFQLEVLDKFLAHLTYIKFYFSVKLD